MLDLNFSEEFSRRADILLNNEELKQAVLDEFETLDPREANIIYRTFNYEPGTIEHQHAKVRVDALVASGLISQELGSLANMEPVLEDTNIDDEEKYSSSRTNFLFALRNQALFNSDENPYDPFGQLEHMVKRGYSKSEITEYLSKNIFYQSQVELSNEGNPDDDLEIGIALFKFQELTEALDQLLDPEEEPDFIGDAKLSIAPYDPDRYIASEIDKGASSQEVLMMLSNNDDWNSDASDFLTRDDVDMPKESQKMKWRAFQTILNNIKDLDSLYEA